MTGSRGAALVLALLALALLMALGASLSVLTSIEMRVAANYAHAQEARNAAETALELVAQELIALSDWSGVAAGTVRSSFADGPPDGVRVLSDGSSVNLTELTLSLGDVGWRLFAYGALRSVESLPTDAYVVVWVRSDPSGGPGDLALRADAFGPSGTRKALHSMVSPLGVLSWKEVR